jgi:phosphoribosylamine--glycine ligase
MRRARARDLASANGLLVPTALEILKILIVGNGGREHALLWKLKQDAPNAEFFITRGNGGTDPLATPLPIAAEEIQALAGWAAQQGIDLTVVGPEAPLADGIVDHFSARGLPIFGPTRAAAEIESSKAFAKALMARHGIPTAAFRTFHAVAEAETYVREMPGPLVVKASGLAAGKGAVVCESTADALAAVREMLAGGTWGEAGRQVVIEEFMQGEELSVFALCDGVNVLPMLPAQDHKRIGEGETGPNTGGMGAYAPVSLATDEMLAQVREEILLPTVAALAEEERPFRGLLYAGLMLTAAGPRVVEFNCRFGDPETEVILPLLESSLLAPVLAISRGESIAAMQLSWRRGAAVTTVLASPGYPGEYPTGAPIHIPEGLERRGDVLVFHSGTARREGTLVTNGGRVLTVTGLGGDVHQAAAHSRSAAEQIQFDGRQFRRDIGWRELERSRRSHLPPSYP